MYIFVILLCRYRYDSFLMYHMLQKHFLHSFIYFFFCQIIWQIGPQLFFLVFYTTLLFIPRAVVAVWHPFLPSHSLKWKSRKELKTRTERTGKLIFNTRTKIKTSILAYYRKWTNSNDNNKYGFMFRPRCW